MLGLGKIVCEDWVQQHIVSFSFLRSRMNSKGVWKNEIRSTKLGFRLVKGREGKEISGLGSYVDYALDVPNKWS